MKPFGDFHPGSSLGRQLFEEKDTLSKQLLFEPLKTIKKLATKYKFGSKTDFWDDFIFINVIAPALSNVVNLNDLAKAINYYSNIDHLLFKYYVRRDEDPDRFRRAFWNLNVFGLRLSERISNIPIKPLRIRTNDLVLNDSKNILFVFKGPFELAHAEFFREFLVGCVRFSSRVNVTLLLLDEPLGNSPLLRKLDHINITSLSHIPDTYSKVIAYRQHLADHSYNHVSWIACVQNLSLYMGFRGCTSQSYWSMKYHSIIMNTIDKYAGLGFGGGSFNFDGINWFRGRAFPLLIKHSVSNIDRTNFRDSHKLPYDAFLFGCFVRSEKLNSEKYWKLVILILRHYKNHYFVVASQSVPAFALEMLRKSGVISQFRHLGWVNTKIVVNYLDLYFDSSPRGSCLTILEAIKSEIPVIMFDSEHNRESSAFPYLFSAFGNRVPQGVLPSVASSEYLFSQISTYLNSESLLLDLVAHQSSLLKAIEGRSSLFAKDYLNYFLDLDLRLK